MFLEDPDTSDTHLSHVGNPVDSYWLQIRGRNLRDLRDGLEDQGLGFDVVTVMRANGGESSAFHTLNRAKELYRSKLNKNNVVDELATLFAECAIAEAFPSTAKPSPFNNMGAHQSLDPDARGTSILTKTGRNQVMMDAFSDGSSFVCLQCGGLVGSNRKDEHYAFWCD
nr:hypothetical protein [Tanacetum cinerariifolium]